MPCNRAEATFLVGIAIFLVGTACLIAVEVQSVFPARREQKFQEINCTVVSGDMKATAKCSNNKQSDQSYPCLRVYVMCGNDLQSDGELQPEKPRLLSKDFHSLHKQCTYEPEQCMQKDQPRPHLLRSFQSGNPIGAPLRCFYNPKDPHEIINQKTSQESYNKHVITSMAWPLGIVVFGIVVVVTAGCFLSAFRSRNGYERIAHENAGLV